VREVDRLDVVVAAVVSKDKASSHNKYGCRGDRCRARKQPRTPGHRTSSALRYLRGVPAHVVRVMLGATRSLIGGGHAVDGDILARASNRYS
jgi:hypothetical protein